MKNLNLKILQVEDSERDAALLARHLTRAGYELDVTRVETAETMRAALFSAQWDLILCDYSMPKFDALSALAVLRSSGFDIPLIIISGTIGEEVAVRAMVAGASDYLMKDSLARLVPAIERETQEAENRRAGKRAEEELRWAEEKYRSIFENAIEGIFQSAVDGRLLSANPALSRLLGFDSAEELIAGRTNLADQHYVDPAMREVLLGLLQKHGVVAGFECEIYRRDGSSIWVIENIRAIRDQQGKLAHFEGSIKDITQAKLAEQQLRIQAAALQAAANAIVITDMKGQVSWVNHAFSVMTGYAPDEVIGGNPRILKSGVHDQAFYHELWQTVLRGQVWHGEIFNRRKDGTVYPEEMTITPVKNGAGEILNFVAIKQDITERKRAEAQRAEFAAEIDENRRRLDNIVARVPGVVWEVSAEPNSTHQRVTFVSEYVEQLTGYSVEEWLASTNFWFSIVHPDDQERAMRDSAASMLNGNEARMEYRWIRKDGHIIWVESNFAVINDEGGQPAGLRGVTIDVTERKHAEQALQLSEERFRELIENAHDIIYTHDLRGNYTSVNQMGQRITGYGHDEALRMNMLDVVAPESREYAKQMLARKLAGEDVTTYELEIISKAGKRIPVEVNTRVIFENGRPAGVQGIARDVTDRKSLEAQLRQAQKMEAIGQLAGGVAHDFNNLLTAINGYSDLAIRTLQPQDPLRHNLEEIKKAGTRAAGLTRQLLAFSRKQVLQPKVLSLNSIVTDLEKMLHRLIGEDVELRVILEPELGNAKADPGQIEQVIMNLAINARDAMPTGGKLTIETQNIELDEDYVRQHVAVEPGPYVILAVSDTGIGMDAETAKRIFEPFFTTKEVGRGTGLGLSTVYGIIKQSNGSIWVYSEPGRGTTFKVYLPRIEDSAEEYKRVDDLEEVLAGNETILLIEDDDTLRRLATEVLLSYGYKVLDAANGGAALLICERHPDAIELLITDVIMPEMNGVEAAERLGKIRPDMKVLFMSGYTSNSVVHQGVFESDMNFIQKPFSPADLARKIRSVLDEKK
ncbi:MAG: PAS domain S-box protein [Pyrinomonadaceae bacterium]